MAERSRYDIYYYIMAGPYRRRNGPLAAASERASESDGSRFKDQRVLGETPNGPYLAFEGQVKYNRPGGKRHLEIVRFSVSREASEARPILSNNKTSLISGRRSRRDEDSRDQHAHNSRFIVRVS